MRRFKNILCVIEHGEASKPALDRAVALAENNQASLAVIDAVTAFRGEFHQEDDITLVVLKFL